MICYGLGCCSNLSIYGVTNTASLSLAALPFRPVRSRRRAWGGSRSTNGRGPAPQGSNTMPQLSDSQLIVLTAACQREDRCVFPVTAKLKGNAAGNVLKSLLKKDLIKEVRAKRDDTVWRHDGERGRMTLVATTAAFAALGIDPRDEAEGDAAEETPASVEAKPNARLKSSKTKEPKVLRKDSKQARLIAMLGRVKGASIDEVVEALKW
jgi:hypothetical protein